MNIFDVVLSNERVKSKKWVFDASSGQNIRTEEGLCPLQVYFDPLVRYVQEAIAIFGQQEVRTFLNAIDWKEADERARVEQALIESSA